MLQIFFVFFIKYGHLQHTLSPFYNERYSHTAEVMLKILSKRAFNIGSRRSERYLAFGAPF